MLDIINPALQWLNMHPHWAGLATFIISACESIAIIGTIIPGTIAMTAIGTLAGANVIPLWATFTYAILGAILGDGISYYLGHHFKGHIRQVWPFRTHPEWLTKGTQFFHRHGGKSIFIGRFVGPVRAIIPVIAGMLGFKPRRFFAASIPAAIAWAHVYMLPGIMLGAVSLELPPDMALHVVLVLFLVSILILVSAWLTTKFFLSIGYKIDRLLNQFWQKLQTSRYAKIITVALKHHDPAETHGQLVLAFYLLLTVVSLCVVTHFVTTYQAQNLYINHVLYHFFRSLRSPLDDNIMLALTMLGDKVILAPVIGILFVLALYTRRFYLAFHVALLGILTGACIEFIKHSVHSVRPWGVLHPSTSYSFPSGHTTLATIFYVGLALLFSVTQPRKRKLLVSIAIFIVACVSVSRLYLNAHWFTDVLGAWLLGAALLLFVSISYNRQKVALEPAGLTKITACAFLGIYFLVCLYRFPQLQENYTQQQLPPFTIKTTAWWKQQNPDEPMYRINRFGQREQLLNVQWMGSLQTIRKTLLENGWETPPERNWISVLLRLSDVNSSEHLPLVSPLHLDKKPVLVLIKHTDNKKHVIVLRLWDSNVILQPEQQTLWVGTVSLIPRTYSWFLKRKNEIIEVTPDMLSKKIEHEFEEKEVIVIHPATMKKQPKSILLIKSKH